VQEVVLIRFDIPLRDRAALSGSPDSVLVCGQLPQRSTRTGGMQRNGAPIRHWLYCQVRHLAEF
jgi:hypothetical protein